MTTRTDMDDLTAEIVGGLDLVPIPGTRPIGRRSRRSRPRVDLAMVAAVVLVGLITATAAAPYAQRALSEGVRLLERVVPRGGPLPLLGTSLAGVRLGATPDDVLGVLGAASRRSEGGWIYDRGIFVGFSGVREETWRVQRIVAWAGSGARTEEGFFLHGCPLGSGFDASLARCWREGVRESAAFRGTYSGFEVEEWTNGRSTRFEAFRILSVRGLTPDGDDVVLRASFGPYAERIELSLSPHERRQWSDADLRRWQGLPPQRLRDLQPPHSLYRADPFAISACELLARAEVTAGYGEGWGIANFNHQDANGRVCAVRNDGSRGDPHVFWYMRPVRPLEVESLLNELPERLDKVLRPVDGWRSTGTGRWSGRHLAGDPMVAVYVEPYFFVVSADSEDHAGRLADAVRAELTGQ